ERLQAHLDLARGYLEKRDASRARKPLNRALSIDKRSWEAHDLYALLFQMEGESELADEHFRRALRSSPNNARVLNNYGAFLYSQGRYRDARRRLEKAIRDPSYVGRSQVYENLGLVQLKLGDVKDAERSFQRSLMLNAAQSRARLELAEIYFNRDEFDIARQYYEAFRNAERQNPRSLWLGIRLARIYSDEDAVASYGLQLRNLYPTTREYE
ncbi:MAG: type IV pilus biogenesis/stability protein PilW, partial [Gammaproteobacteria bacterium]